VSKLAFGHTWDNDERLRKVCSDVLALAERPEWKSLELLCGLTRELYLERFQGMKDILEVRENAGLLDGIKKVLALPDDCRQVLKHGGK